MSVLEWIAIVALAIAVLGMWIGRFLAWRQGPMCWCGHRADAHYHYRPGTECADCDACKRFRPTSG